jgi:hypothetical protein
MAGEFEVNFSAPQPMFHLTEVNSLIEGINFGEIVGYVATAQKTDSLAPFFGLDTLRLLCGQRNLGRSCAWGFVED